MGRISMGRVTQCAVAVAYLWLFTLGDAAKQVQIRRSNGLAGTPSSARRSSSSSSGRQPHADAPPPSRKASSVPSARSRASPADAMAGSEAEIRRKNAGAHRIGGSSSLSSNGGSRDRASAILTDLKTNPQRTGSTRDKTLKGTDGQLVSELGVPVADVPRGSASLQSGLARGLGGGGSSNGGPLAAISPLIQEIVGKVGSGGGLANLGRNSGGAGNILNNLMKNFG